MHNVTARLRTVAGALSSGIQELGGSLLDRLEQNRDDLDYAYDRSAAIALLSNGSLDDQSS